VVESTELIKKLQIKAGTRLWFVNVPQDIAEAQSAGAEVEPVRAGDECDGVVAFATTPVEATEITKQALKVLSPDGLLWFAYRKGSTGKATGLTRDEGWDALAKANWRPVRSVSINDTWTGLRFRPADLAKSDRPERWRVR